MKNSELENEMNLNWEVPEIDGEVPRQWDNNDNTESAFSGNKRKKN